MFTTQCDVWIINPSFETFQMPLVWLKLTRTPFEAKRKKIISVARYEPEWTFQLNWNFVFKSYLLLPYFMDFSGESFCWSHSLSISYIYIYLFNTAFLFKLHSYSNIKFSHRIYKTWAVSWKTWSTVLWKGGTTLYFLCLVIWLLSITLWPTQKLIGL